MNWKVVGYGWTLEDEFAVSHAGVSGTHTILVALNCPDETRQGLMGFAFERETVGAGGKGPKFLRSQKVFKSIIPDPKNARDPQVPTKPAAFYTNKFPVQSFVWGDYAAMPETTYHFRILPMFGRPGALTTNPKHEIKFVISTEREWGPNETHGVWFNRGAIASQKFAEEFGNEPPRNINDPGDPTVKWLSRGLLEACLAFINETKAGDALRVAAYEFTYATKIPHNKFIVRLQGGKKPVEVWTGSTNFTASGFLGQTNVGHRIKDNTTAEQYLAFWELVKTDPELDDAREELAKLTPDPAEAIETKSVVRFFSPRSKAVMLRWYGRRMLDAADSVWFTAAFGVSKTLVQPIAKKRPQMRFVLMEKPAPPAQKKALCADFNRVILSYGVPLGEVYQIKNGKVTSRKPVKEFELDKWFFKEELYRPKNDG
ncbi:MAG: hypothetical protein ABSG53_28990, partial [Thermoguttaceae bacterium]